MVPRYKGRYLQVRAKKISFFMLLFTLCSIICILFALFVEVLFVCLHSFAL